ncbi:hypothetical protein FOIG_08636 [Fusarium odoratissimum NRRL 54006]|uniref:Uncharacterized protein n=2 Tax=Fusarium oxysporum species complex TaxID=171631 RepID=X0JEG0_FUSO5|nr:uncharacterized protein FOIG_08636 [Fusarium odoratissimum NRRL 54006]EXL99613.1 hypothetical protein FOIG_08636 [Fusarium odoratissimum NRRL 54006]TXC02994.1 hypothetical protein FocTR4_00015511 [Fusarium oxysporum f. sp. cubense]
MLCLFNVKKARSFIKTEEGGKDVDNAAKVDGLGCNRTPKSAKLCDHEFTANGAFALGEEITLFKGKMDMAQTKKTTARACA